MWIFWLAVYKLRWVLGAIALLIIGLVGFGVVSIMASVFPGLGVILAIIAVGFFVERNSKA